MTQRSRICFLLALCAFISITVKAQRSLCYYPDNHDLVCLNGTNSYTRALYGTSSPWLLLTSDRPSFASLKEGEVRKVDFALTVGDTSYPLDSTSYCEARYNAGMRYYTLADDRWEGGLVTIICLARADSEGAIWKCSADGFPGAVSLRATMGTTSFNLLSAHAPLQNPTTVSAPIGECLYALLQTDSLDEHLRLSASAADSILYEAAWNHQQQLEQTIDISTPDAFLNTLGGSMAAAADGLWDDSTRQWRLSAMADPQAATLGDGACMGDYLGWYTRQRQFLDSSSCSPSPDMLLHHFLWDADSAHMRNHWQTLTADLKAESKSPELSSSLLSRRYASCRLAARVASVLGEDPKPFEQEATSIANTLQQRLWLRDECRWAERIDNKGVRHTVPALWSVYNPIINGVGTRNEWLQATEYVDSFLPHVPIGPIAVHQTDDDELSARLRLLTADLPALQTVSTSSWQPYQWTLHNVMPAEMMRLALAYFKAGRADDGYRLMKTTLADNMFLSPSPANFSLTSSADKALGYQGTDVADAVGSSARTLVEGLFGIEPDALGGSCTLHYRLPRSWNEASLRTPYITLSIHRDGEELVCNIEQRFPKRLRMVLEAGDKTVTGTTDSVQTLRIALPAETALPQVNSINLADITYWGTSQTMLAPQRCKEIEMDTCFNATLGALSAYIKPQSIADETFRTLIRKDLFTTPQGLPFRTPAEGRNIALASLLPAYPDSVSVPLKGKASIAWLLLCGTTHAGQAFVPNGKIVVSYEDGSEDSLLLVNPYNWCPVERDYLDDNQTFSTFTERPYRLAFATGNVSVHLVANDVKPGKRIIEGGAGVILGMPIDADKRLRRLTLHALASGEVLGVMAVTLQK